MQSTFLGIGILVLGLVITISSIADLVNKSQNGGTWSFKVFGIGVIVLSCGIQTIAGW